MYNLYEGIEVSNAVKSTYSNTYNGNSGLIGEPGPKGPPGENGNLSKDDLSIFSTLGISLTGFGQNWVEKPTNITNMAVRVSLSASGKYQTIATENDYIYVSSDFGNTWIQNTNSPQKQWQGVSLSNGCCILWILYGWS